MGGGDAGIVAVLLLVVEEDVGAVGLEELAFALAAEEE